MHMDERFKNAGKRETRVTKLSIGKSRVKSRVGCGDMNRVGVSVFLPEQAFLLRAGFSRGSPTPPVPTSNPLS